MRKRLLNISDVWDRDDFRIASGRNVILYNVASRAKSCAWRSAYSHACVCIFTLHFRFLVLSVNISDRTNVAIERSNVYRFVRVSLSLDVLFPLL